MHPVPLFYCACTSLINLSGAPLRGFPAQPRELAGRWAGWPEKGAHSSVLTDSWQKRPALPQAPVSVLPLSCATDQGHKKMGLEGNRTLRAITFLIATWKQKSQGKEEERFHAGFLFLALHLHPRSELTHVFMFWHCRS